MYDLVGLDGVVQEAWRKALCLEHLRHSGGAGECCKIVRGEISHLRQVHRSRFADPVPKIDCRVDTECFQGSVVLEPVSTNEQQVLEVHRAIALSRSPAVIRGGRT